MKNKRAYKRNEKEKAIIKMKMPLKAIKKEKEDEERKEEGKKEEEMCLKDKNIKSNESETQAKEKLYVNYT